MEAAYELSKKQVFLRKNIESFIKQFIAPVVAETNGMSEFPKEILEKLAKNRLLGMLAPKDDKGEGAGFLDLCLIVESIAKVCPTTALVCLIQNLGAKLVSREGSQAQKEKYLKDLMEGKSIFGYVASAAELFSLNLVDTSLTFASEGDEYAISGPECHVINGDAADLVFMFAKNESADGCFLVESQALNNRTNKAEGFVGAEARCTTTATLENCSIPQASVLGALGNGKGVLREMVCEGAVLVSALALGVGQGALDYAVRYSKEREQFGMQINKFQAVKMLLATMDEKMEAVRQFVYKAASALDQQSNERNRLSSLAKAFSSQTAIEVTTDAVQVVGGYGYMKDYPQQKMMRAALLTQVLNGTVHSHQLTAAG